MSYLQQARIEFFCNEYAVCSIGMGKAISIPIDSIHGLVGENRQVILYRTDTGLVLTAIAGEEVSHFSHEELISFSSIVA